jgi:hypothetical protein
VARVFSVFIFFAVDLDLIHVYFCSPNVLTFYYNF